MTDGALHDRRGGFPTRPRRRSIRLPGYDYAQAGAYFVTICAYRRACLFGAATGDMFHLTPSGDIAAACWHDLPHHYPNLALDAFVVMPNHVHGIVMLTEPEAKDAKRAALSEVVRGYKTWAARRINGRRRRPGTPVWQRGYHEHIIRNEASLNDIREYIVTNPLRWALDHENPDYERVGNPPLQYKEQVRAITDDTPNGCRGGFPTRPRRRRNIR